MGLPKLLKSPHRIYTCKTRSLGHMLRAGNQMRILSANSGGIFVEAVTRLIFERNIEVVHPQHR